MISLKKLEGQKIKVKAVIKDLGKKKGWKDKDLEIITFENLLDSKGNILKSETEMNLTKRFTTLKLKKGDFITFFAFVRFDQKLNDFKFTNPSQIKIIQRTKQQKLFDIPITKKKPDKKDKMGWSKERWKEEKQKAVEKKKQEKEIKGIEKPIEKKEERTEIKKDKEIERPIESEKEIKEIEKPIEKKEEKIEIKKDKEIEKPIESEKEIKKTKIDFLEDIYDLEYIIDHFDEINEKVKALVELYFNNPNKILSLYEQIKKEIVFKDFCTLDRFLIQLYKLKDSIEDNEFEFYKIKMILIKIAEEKNI